MTPPKCAHDIHPAYGRVSIHATLLVVLSIVAIGGGGWVVWTLYSQHEQTVLRLGQAEASLKRSEGSIAVLEEERRKLAEEYETLKARWGSTSQQLQDFAKSSTEMSGRLAAVSQARSELQRGIDGAHRETAQLQARVTQLQREAASTAEQQIALEGQLKEAVSRSLTPAEVEQVSQRLAVQQEEEQRLNDRIAELSGAYEQLLQGQAQPTQRPAVALGHPVSAPQASDQRPSDQRPDAKRLVRLYHDLGNSYTATHQYAQAAEAFECSLELNDDPAIHAKLADIYSHFLHNSGKAQHHAALAPPTSSATVALDGSARAYGYPRKGWRHVWRWLTQ